MPTFFASLHSIHCTARHPEFIHDELEHAVYRIKLPTVYSNTMNLQSVAINTLHHRFNDVSSTGRRQTHSKPRKLSLPDLPCLTWYIPIPSKMAPAPPLREPRRSLRLRWRPSRPSRRRASRLGAMAMSKSKLNVVWHICSFLCSFYCFVPWDSVLSKSNQQKFVQVI